MGERKRMFLLILIMTTVSMVVVGITTNVLYRTAFQQARERLVETAQSQARLIEAVARFDAVHERIDPESYPAGSTVATLRQIVDAHKHYRGFGETGEFTLARRETDNIFFLLRHRHYDLEQPKPVPFGSKLAEPMRRALSGLSGTVVGLDYRGEIVLAAYEPVAELNWGSVAKIDLAEVRAPFMRAGLLAICAALLVVFVGAVVFLRVSNPMIRRLEESENRLREKFAELDHIYANAPVGLCLMDTDLRFVRINEKLAAINGKPVSAHIGRTLEDIIPGIAPRIEPIYRQIMKSGEPFLNFEVRGVTPGEPEVPRHWLISYHPLMSEEDTVQGVSTVVQDVTELKQAENELKWEFGVNAALSDLYKPLISPSSSIAKITITILDQAKRLTGSPHGFVSSIDPTTGDNVAHTLTEMMEAQCKVEVEHKRIAFPRGDDGLYQGLWGYSLNTLQPFFANSPETYPASTGIPEGHIPLKSFLSVPVMLGGELVGQIALANKKKDYTERDLEAIRRLAESYALAIQRRRAEEALQEAHAELEIRVEERTAELVRANEQLKKSEDELRILSSQLLTAQENERARIARELHDGIGQSLSAIKFRIEDALGQMGKNLTESSVNSLNSLIPVIQSTVEEVRKITMDLRPSTLDDLGILATIAWFSREFQETYTNVRIQKEIGLGETDIPESLKTVIFRVVQETLNNVAKHSGADSVTIFLRKRNDTLELTIEDNGRGFDLEEELDIDGSKRGFGLGSMKERIELSGGSFSLESVRRQGTTIRASWPG
jgi:PAS domain S-box-containing protein